MAKNDLDSHGRYKTYADGCRCVPCSDYQNSRVARNRADRLASGRLSHGTRSARDAGCGCTDCLATRRKVVSVQHNHMTRDIKSYGICEACDNYWAGTDVR